MKTKYLTRSHAMREATSPPRTPTPRSDRNSDFNGINNNDTGVSESKMHLQSSPTKFVDCVGALPPVIVTSQNQCQTGDNNGAVICEADFPKLTPPKSSKNSRNTNTNTKDQSHHQNNNNSCRDISSNRSDNSNSSSKSDVLLSPPRSGYNNKKASDNEKTNGNDYSQIITNDPLASPPRNDSQNSFTVDENQNDTGGRVSSSSSSTHSSTGPKKFHKLNTPNSTSNSKGSKPRLKNMGSSSSCEGVNSNSNSTSGFISRDSSTEQFTDSNGVDLIGFFKETLNKNIKDRNTLLQIEEDLIDLVDEKSRREMRFPAASSYHRMLIHRTAAFFGMDHNVDTETQTCVIVTKTRSTRIPDIRFNTLLCRELLNDDQPPRKSILKRDSHSFDDPRQGFLCPERMMLDRKAKSFEEREEEYEKARTRIFRNRENDDTYWSWHHEKGDQISRLRQNKMLKVKSMSTDSRDQRPSVSKANSFGGYGGPASSNNSSLNRGNSMNMSKSAGSRYISKQDSVGSNNTPWRMSPSSSGYKTQTQSLRSESATPSPSGSGSCDDDITPEEPPSPQPKSGGIMWAVSDMASVPKGSVLIDPQTLQPLVNRDGSIYHYDPSNLPPSQVLAPGMYNTTNNKNKLQAKKSMENNNSCNNNMINNNRNSKQMISSSTSTTAGVSDLNSNETDNATLSSDTVDSSENTVTTPACSVNIIKTTVTNSCNTSKNDDAKDKHEESENEQLPSTSILHANAEFYSTDTKPLVKNQATSPKIPTPDPDDKLSEGCDILSETKTSTPASPAPVQQDARKDDPQNIQSHHPVIKSSNIPIMSFAPPASYQIDGTTIYPQSNPQGSGAYPTATYQQGVDGNLYAVPPSMVYAYPQPMDGEVQGYYMSIYDPTGSSAVAAQNPGTPGQAIYQPGGPTVVPVAAYTSAPFPGAQFYQGPVIYSTDQFPHGTNVAAATTQSTTSNASQAATPATPTGQIPQYPLTATYPISYTYPSNGYWGQPMTYYVPQQALTNTPSGVIAHIPHAQSQSVDSQKSVNNCGVNNGGTTINGKKRSTPPHISNSQLHQTNSHPATPVTANTTYQFASAVPLALTPATDINGQPMYAAIQAPHTFSTNILPYASTSTSTTPQTPPSSSAGSTSSAALGVLTPITPHPTNATHNTSSPSNQTVINSLVPTTSSSATSSPTSSSSSTTTSYKNMQSAPSTPLSTTTASTSYLTNRSNPPLFPTPPIFVAANGGYHPHHYYDISVDKRGNHTGKRNSNGYVPNGRQHSYASSIPQTSSHLRKLSSIDSSSSINNHRSNQLPKRLPISNNSSGIGNHSSETKPRMMNSGGIYRQQKPSSLDFKKNGFSYNTNNNGHSQRNTPSTNSVESGSPNSIVSSMNGSTVTSAPTGQFVAPGTYVATEYHLTGGHHGNPHHQAPTAFYMTTAAARGSHIPSSIHHAPNAASVVAAEVANAACHQPLIGTYNPHHATHHPHNGAGMYFKYGQPYFAPTMALPNNRRSPPSEIRPSMTPLTGVFPAVNMMIQAPRQLQPRHPNPNYKGNKTR
ncbi:R3HDM1 family protein [Megaselia abdita]